MTHDEFKALPEDEQESYKSHRRCPKCKARLLRTAHSTGDLHVQCLDCKICPDCDDGE